MTPVNIDIVDRIIDAVYRKYQVKLNKVEVRIDKYQETGAHIFEPIRFNAIYIVVIPIAGKHCTVSLAKSEIDETTDIGAEIERQIEEQKEK
jgi:hypothetical protein